MTQCVWHLERSSGSRKEGVWTVTAWRPETRETWKGDGTSPWKGGSGKTGKELGCKMTGLNRLKEIKMIPGFLPYAQN